MASQTYKHNDANTTVEAYKITSANYRRVSVREYTIQEPIGKIMASFTAAIPPKTGDYVIVSKGNGQHVNRDDFESIYQEV